MVYSYQKDSYLKELSCKVLTCEAIKDGRFEITLDDTVLFPEGGGQPDDRGKIGDISVDKVARRGATAIHYSSSRLQEGSDVQCQLDWQRRFDHMQQHSAQHLISALIEQAYGFKTTSWDLGRSISHIELDAPKITQEQIDSIEHEANEKIREHHSVVVHFLTKEEAQTVEEVHSRGLPDDHVGTVRIIEIEGVEKNMCCGTHVHNLSELQIIKLLHTEGMRGGTRLMFIAGNRVLDKVKFCYNNERSLTKLLSSGPEDHAASVEKLMKNSRTTLKTCKSYLKEIARFEASSLKTHAIESGALCHHREDGDQDYINAFLQEFGSDSKDVLLCISVGEKKTGGQFVLIGSDARLQSVSKSVCDLLNAKGGGKKGRFQGKAANFSKLEEAHKIIKASAVE